jgi:hypothetical protein
LPTLYGPSIPRSILLVSRACRPVFPTVFPAGRATRGGGRSIILASAGGLRVFENDSVSLRYSLTPSRAWIASGITDVAYMDISTLFGAVSGCTQTRRLQAHLCFVSSSSRDRLWALWRLHSDGGQNFVSTERENDAWIRRILPSRALCIECGCTVPLWMKTGHTFHVTKINKVSFFSHYSLPPSVFSIEWTLCSVTSLYVF